MFHNRCRYCGAGGLLERDHRVPMSRGGLNRISNIVPACRRCNSVKASATEDEFLKAVRLSWGRRVPRTPPKMEARLAALEARHAGDALQSRGETLLQSLGLPAALEGRFKRAEIAVHREVANRVAGISYHLDAATTVLGGRDEWKGYALLLAETDNPADATAVAVVARGRRIGFLPRDLAQRMHSDLLASESTGTAVAARAVLFHGERGTGGRVLLDTPLRTRSA
jgi:hypothetical protein